jgi:hypothetical protein
MPALGLKTANCQQPTANCLLPTAYFSKILNFPNKPRKIAIFIKKIHLFNKNCQKKGVANKKTYIFAAITLIIHIINK